MTQRLLRQLLKCQRMFNNIGGQEASSERPLLCSSHDRPPSRAKCGHPQTANFCKLFLSSRRLASFESCAFNSLYLLINYYSSVFVICRQLSKVVFSNFQAPIKYIYGGSWAAFPFFSNFCGGETTIHMILVSFSNFMKAQPTTPYIYIYIQTSGF